MFKSLAASPKSTAMAVLMIAQQVLLIAMAFMDGDPATNPDWAAAAAIIMAAIGFLFARDQASHDAGK